jgi:hypothetical protein
MALETVHFDCRVAMALSAKMTRISRGNRFIVVTFHYMTSKTVFQAVFFCTDAFMYRFVTLVH